jgi:hypothetical protein
MHRQCPTGSRNQQNWYVISKKFHRDEHVTYVDGGVVAAGTEGTAADAIGIVIVLVPVYIVLVSRIVVVLVASISPDLLMRQATSTVRITSLYSRS